MVTVISSGQLSGTRCPALTKKSQERHHAVPIGSGVARAKRPSRGWGQTDNMDTWDAIRARRDVRQYADRPIAHQDLEHILEAGRRAPSAQNRQPWDFVVVTDRTSLQELSNVSQGARHIAGSAATVALIGLEPEDTNQRDLLQYDFGQASANMMLAATDLGVGSGHAAVFAQAEPKRVLGVPDGPSVHTSSPWAIPPIGRSSPF